MIYLELCHLLRLLVLDIQVLLHSGAERIAAGINVLKDALKLPCASLRRGGVQGTKCGRGGRDEAGDVGRRTADGRGEGLARLLRC